MQNQIEKPCARCGLGTPINALDLDGLCVSCCDRPTIDFAQMDEAQKTLKSFRAVIEEHGCAQPVRRCLYETFNGSIVYVYSKEDYEKSSQTKNALIHEIESMFNFSKNKTTAPDHYIGVVLFGGHQNLNSSRNGRCIGSEYRITVAGAYDVENQGVWLKYPELLGLCLKSCRCDVEFIANLLPDFAEG